MPGWGSAGCHDDGLIGEKGEGCCEWKDDVGFVVTVVEKSSLSSNESYTVKEKIR